MNNNTLNFLKCLLYLVLFIATSVLCFMANSTREVVLVVFLAFVSFVMIRAE